MSDDVEPNPHHRSDRSIRLYERTPIELTLSHCIWAIEKMGAHPLLTDAQRRVMDALGVVSQWTDLGEPGKTTACYMPSPGDVHHEHLVPKPGGLLEQHADMASAVNPGAKEENSD